MPNTLSSRKGATLLLEDRAFGQIKAVSKPHFEQQSNMAENGVIWVKKTTFDILIRDVILEVGDAEKRGFNPF